MEREEKFSKIVEASAGSGKTYSLARQFINLLALYMGDFSFVGVSKPTSIGSLVAITFTNKAAGEMKERILNLLKSIGIESKELSSEGFRITKEGAKKALIEIIENASDFNVTTIDSFMNRLLKAISFDVGLNPDYEVSFDRDELFDMAFSELLSDSFLKRELIEFLKEQLRLDKEGFNPERIIRSSIYQYRDVLIPERVLDTFELIRYFEDKYSSKFDDFGNVKRCFNQLEKSLSGDIKTVLDSATFDGSKKRSLEGFSLRSFNKPSKAVINLLEGNYKYILKKDSNEDDISLAERLSNIIREAFGYFQDYIYIQAAKDSSSVFKILKSFREKESRLFNELNIFDGGKISSIVGDYLTKDGLTYAFCVIGERILHYLIDEFQDTSRMQFYAVEPLIENAMSQGGSLFVVGDRKQAIYSWRGGDYTLFDELKERYKGQIDILTLTENFRSKKTVVEFNNSIFASSQFIEFFERNSSKSDISYIEDISQNEKFSSEIRKIYGENTTQKPKSEDDGYVRVILKQEEEGFDRDQFNLEKLKDILNELLYEKNVQPKNIMILVRSKRDLDTVVDFLLYNFEVVGILTEDSLKIKANAEIKKLLLIASAILKPVDHYNLALDEFGVEIDKAVEEKAKLLSPYEFFSFLIERFNLNYSNNTLYFDAFLEKVLELSLKNRDLGYIVDYFNNRSDITVSAGEGADAIKVMTIHKSKGLESHTVIVPYYDWKIKAPRGAALFGQVSLGGEFELPFFFKIDSLLSKINRDAKELYDRARVSSFIESVNLMYVANTRAVQNLFIVGSFKKKRGKCDGFLPVSCILHEVLGIEDVFQLGKLKVEKRKAKEGAELPRKEIHINHNIRKFIKSYPDIFEPEAGLEAKRFGDLFHQTMALIGVLRDRSEIEQVANNSYERAKGIIGYDMDGVLESVKDAIERLFEYFSDIERFFNEKEFVDENGDILRVDRLSIKNGTPFIIDYKTGAKSKEHIQQVKRYMKLFKNSKGLIYYTKFGEIVYVEDN